MANKNLKKIALGAGVLSAGLAPLNAQTYVDKGSKASYSTNTEQSEKRKSESSSRLNIGAMAGEENNFLEASYQVGNNDFFVGPYLKVGEKTSQRDVKYEQFKTHIINNMNSVTDQYTKNTQFNSMPIEAGIKFSQGFGPLELSLNTGLRRTEKWAQRAVYGNDKIVDDGIEVRNENFNLPVKKTKKNEFFDFAGSAEVLIKPFRWLGFGAGMDLKGNGYLTTRLTFGGNKK